MAIQLDSKDFKKRTNEIRKLLLPLSKNNNLVAAKRVPTALKGSIVFVVYGGSSPMNSDHNDWSFKTHNDEYKGSYFEVWLEKNDSYFLEKAYFRLSLIKENKNKEILSLHIDPSEKVSKYKMGPHIHINSSFDIISNAHISLNLSDLHLVVNSYEKFIEAYKNALTMIKEEIILK